MFFVAYNGARVAVVPGPIACQKRVGVYRGLHKMPSPSQWLDLWNQHSIEELDAESGFDAIGEQRGSIVSTETKQAQRSIEQLVDEPGVDAIGQQTESIETYVSEQVPQSMDAPSKACTTL